MDAACVKQSLVNQIQKLAEHPELYSQNPGRDFTRNRKLTFCTLISFILNMHGGSLTNEIIDYFFKDGISVSSSAVVQMHIAKLNGRFCGAKRPRCGASGRLK